MRLIVQIPDDKQYVWRATAGATAEESDFRSRSELGHKPRKLEMGEDAATYCGVSVWETQERAMAEARSINEARVENGKPRRFEGVVEIALDGHEMHCFADDFGPDGHFTAWAEPRHMRRSTTGPPVPIDE